MEPLSALALCGNLFQFLEAAGKIIAEGRQIYHSTSGTTANNRHALDVYDDFRAVAEGLACRFPGPTTPDDRTVRSLASRAQAISGRLMQHLKSHGARSPRSFWHSLGAVWRSVRDRQYLELAEKQLDQIRQELILRLLYMMR